VAKLIQLELSRPSSGRRVTYIGYVERSKVLAVVARKEYPQGWPYTEILFETGVELESDLTPAQIAKQLDAKEG
jgi:hypothetical protein